MINVLTAKKMKRYFNIFSLLALLVLVSNMLSAQQIPVYNQYLINPYVYNPARAGSGTLGTLFLGQRKQWADIPNAPDSKIMTFTMPIAEQKSGVGITMFADNTHIINKVGGSLSYAYHLPMSAKSGFSLGLSAGFINQRFDFADARVQNPNDNVLLDRNVSQTAFDLGFGIHYHFDRLHIDLSVPQLSNTNVRYLDNAGKVSSFELINHWLGSARYVIPISKSDPTTLTLEPVLMVRGAKGLPAQYDANVLLKWYDKFWLSGGYRSGAGDLFASSYNLGTGFRVADFVIASYNYEFGARVLDRFSLGNTHEFSLGFRFGRGAMEMKNELMDLISKVDKVEEEQIAMAEEQEKATQAKGDGVMQSTGDVSDLSDLAEQQELLEQLEMLKKLRQLEELQRLQDLQRLQELQKLKELQDLQKIKALEDIKNSKQDDSTKVALAKMLEEGPGQNGETYGNPTNRTGNGTTDGTNAPNGDNVIFSTPSGLNFQKIGAVYFKVNSAELSEVAKADLRAVHTDIRNLERVITVYIAGNASIEGTSAYNMLLSNRRAISVKNYLSKLGMVESIVLPIPYGAENPITEDQTYEEDRQKNRRVDVFILAQ